MVDLAEKPDWSAGVKLSDRPNAETLLGAAAIADRNASGPFADEWKATAQRLRAKARYLRDAGRV